MISSDFIKIFHELWGQGYNLPMIPGVLLARGFADLGFEEFNLLSGNRVVSKATGQTSTIDPSEISKCFVLPSIDIMISEIRKAGWDIDSLIFFEQRDWLFTLIKDDNDNDVYTLVDRSLMNVVAKGLYYVITGTGFDSNEKPRNLKVEINE